MNVDPRVEELQLQIRRLEQESANQAHRAQRYRDILDRLPQAVCRLHKDGVIGFVNRSGSEALGAPPGELIGRNFLSLCTPDDRKRYESAWRQLDVNTTQVEVACDDDPGGGSAWTFDGIFDSQGKLESIQAYRHISAQISPDASTESDTVPGPTVPGSTTPGDAPSASQPASRRRVLVVDDEDMVCTLAEKVLERFGFDVQVAKTGNRALEIFQAQHRSICVVLLDMSLPDIDGKHVFDKMRQLRSDIPVIISSGYDSLSAGHRLASQGVSFLPKPYMPDQLVQKVREMLGE